MQQVEGLSAQLPGNVSMGRSLDDIRADKREVECRAAPVFQHLKATVEGLYRHFWGLARMVESDRKALNAVVAQMNGLVDEMLVFHKEQEGRENRRSRKTQDSQQAD